MMHLLVLDQARLVPFISCGFSGESLGSERGTRQVFQIVLDKDYTIGFQTKNALDECSPDERQFGIIRQVREIEGVMNKILQLSTLRGAAQRTAAPLMTVRPASSWLGPASIQAGRGPRTMRRPPQSARGPQGTSTQQLETQRSRGEAEQVADVEERTRPGLVIRGHPAIGVPI
jgi:hypothetical protein